MFVVWSK